MKLVIPFIFLLFSSHLWAGDGGSIGGFDNKFQMSWDQIHNSAVYNVVKPKLKGGIFNLCADKNNLRTIKPVESCVWQKVDDKYGPGPDYECVDTQTNSYNYPRAYTRDVCPTGQQQRYNDVNGLPIIDCTDWKTVSKTIPLVHKLEVVYDPNPNTGLSFKKDYRIPNCQ